MLLNNPLIENAVSCFDNGEIITNIILKKTTIEVTEEDIFVYLKENIFEYWLPNYIVFVDKFELNKNGKIIIKKNQNFNKIIREKKDNSILTLILNKIEEIFSVDIFDVDKPLFMYGFDSLKLMMLNKILSDLLNFNFNNSIHQDNSINDIINMYAGFLEYFTLKKSQIKDNSDELFIMFRDGARNYLSNIDVVFPHIDKIIVEHFSFTKNKDPYDVKFDYIKNYMKNYKKIYIFARCAGCLQATNYLEYADKIIFDSPSINLYDQIIKKDKLISQMMNNSHKIYYYVGSKRDKMQADLFNPIIESNKLAYYELHVRHRQHLYFTNLNFKNRTIKQKLLDIIYGK